LFVCGVLLGLISASWALEAEPIDVAVSLLIFDPPVEGKSVREACGWGDPPALTEEFVETLHRVSHGLVTVAVVETLVSWDFPPKVDGFQYTRRQYVQCWNTGKGWHEPDTADYGWITREFQLASRIDAGAVDEVWIWGGPYFGFWESTMAGPGAYFCNSDPVESVESTRPFVIMGFSYERGVGEMFENMGHRTESVMTHVYGSWETKETHAWNRFTLYDKVSPGKAACGNVHFAPNSENDYDWGNPRRVWSTCDDWLDYPNLRGTKRIVDCTEWGAGDIRLHHEWWFSRLPHAPGRTEGKLNNWWAYVFEFYKYPEGR
jgi:hypothetical protein